MNVRQGPIGPQIDLEANKYLPGNSNLTQYELFKGLTGNRMDYIEFVSLKRINDRWIKLIWKLILVVIIG